jgi:hypothetical protein
MAGIKLPNLSSCRYVSGLWIRLNCLQLLSSVTVFGAVSTTVLFGDFLSGCLVLFASLFMVFKVSLEIEIKTKGKK